MYRDLGFIRVAGTLDPARACGRRSVTSTSAAARRRDRRPTRAAYAYLIYPHKPIVAYVPETGRLLSEYCVEFPDLPARSRSRACPTPTTCSPSGWR